MNFLSKEEEYELLVTFNDTGVYYSENMTFVDLFEEQVSKTPHNIAIVFEDSVLTYQELNQRSNQLAHYLEGNYDIQPDDLVGIKQGRSEWMIISMLGVLKAGGAYFPIDPGYPQERIDYIEDDTKCKICLGETELHKFKESQEEYSTEKAVSGTKPDSLAYVIYTSGSTGRPKGVMVEHASLINYIKWAQSKYWNGSSPLDFGLFTSLSFDLTVTSIFLPLMSGGKLTIFSSKSDVSTILKEYFESEIGFIKLTPAHIGLLGQLDLKSTKVQIAIVGGDKLEQAHVEILRKLNPAIRIYNEYGPTESTVGCTLKEIGFEKEAILIGCPIANTYIYILNEKEELQPVGVIGEIYIGGNSLARGYLNQDELTKEKFIASPFKEGERLYRTGDLGRWLPDGNIEFIGRKDDQVKIRGYRIETGEIESVLANHEAVENSLVLAKENEDGEKSLIAYVVPGKNKAYTVNQILKANKLDLGFNAMLYEMDNGLSMYAYNGPEVKWLYREVFELKTYYKHGIVIPKNACIVDVGANIGAFSIFSLLTFENPRIYSFEPLVPIYRLLEKNIGLYNGNVEIFNVGISDREEKGLDFYPYSTDGKMDELLKNGLVKKEYAYQLKTFSQVIKENAIAHINLLKIDVETAELDAVCGIAEEDWAKVDQVVIKVYDDNDRLRKIRQILSSHGFTVSVYQTDDLKGTKSYDLYCIREKGIVEGKIKESFKDHWYSTNTLIKSVRQRLNDKLPDYMVPAELVLLNNMPLTSNGKIDRKALLEIDVNGVGNKIEFIAPRTVKEKILASVWTDVLKRDNIGIKDSFYNLGGDSIKSIRVAARLKQHGYRIKVEHLLQTPVLEELAQLMELIIQVAEQLEVSGEVVLTPIQEWFFESSEIRERNHFNQSVLLYSKEPLDGKILEKSIEDLTRHHDALRMVYRQREGSWQQFNQDTRSKRYTFDFYDLRKSDDVRGQMTRLGEVLQSSISLTEGPLVRVVHFRLEDGDRLGLIIHHLVVDGVSWRILLEDLSNLYKSHKAGKKPVLTSKTDSFQRWSLLQKEYAADKKLESERTYWQRVCDQRIDGLAKDKAAKEFQVAIIDSSESFGLDKKTTELLQTRVHGVYNTEINDVLLTSLGLALKEVLSADKTVLQIEGHGREGIVDGIDISRTVGWFTTVYPFVLDVSNSSNHAEPLIAVKEDLRRVPNKGIGYGILTYLSQVRLESKLTPQLTFNYLGDFGANVSNDEGSLFEYAAERIGSDVSKENRADGILDVSGMMVRGELGLSIRYSSSRYDVATIKKLARSYKKNLELLIEELADSKQTYLTPSDLNFKGLSQEDILQLNSDNTLEDVYELSPLQKGIYYHWLAETSGSLYFEQISYRLRTKDLVIAKIKGAYDRLTARHAVLRTSFSTGYADRPLQIVRKEVSSNFTSEKIGSLADGQAQVKVELIRHKDRERGFDLSRGSQMRLHVVDLAEDEYEFIWSYHHILMDGWCMSVLINDFNELLSADTAGRTLDLPPALPYSNYINWLKKIDRDRSLTYWRDYLSGYSALAEIPFKAETAETTYFESNEHLQIGGDLFKKVDALCNGLGITHNTFLQGVWGYLLSRYNNTSDVVFGAVVSGRPADLTGVEEMIGLFINTIPVRVKYDADDSPATLLKSLHEQSIRGTSHHYMNLSEVQSQSELGMELMNHIMIFENYGVMELKNEGVFNSRGKQGFSIESAEVFERTNYDFNILVSPSAGSLGINIKYNLNRYDQLLLKSLVRHFDKLIVEFAENTDQSLRTIDYLAEEEKCKLLVTFNDTTVGYPKDKTVVDLFEEQVAKTPWNIAVVFEDTELTYRELDERSNQLAHYLRDHYSIEPDDLVGIKQERSEWMIISILGVLKSGGAYVPIDMQAPGERVRAIAEDSKCKVLLDLAELIKFRKFQEEYSREQMITATKSSNLAYIIYTSGSTGKPKGVMIEHRNVINFFTGMTNIFGEEKGAFLSMTNFTFDISVLELLWTLCKGYKVVIQGEARQISEDQDDYSVYSQIKKHRITHLQITPSMGALLNQHLTSDEGWSSIKNILLGGEPATASLVNDIYQKLPDTQLYNMYGPTETTIWSTVKALEKNIQKIEIGKPIANTRIYILDQYRKQVPAGVQGEIYIGGEGVARGYTSKALTDLSFVENPSVPGERIYRTGDFGTWLNSGSIYCSGRKDQQVKIRGYRIELGEIEHALLENEQIKEAVVISRENISGEKQLVAYITSQRDLNIGELRLFLKELLPNYMIPSHFVRLEELPLNVNGKVDRRSLPDHEGLGLASGVEYVAPRNEIETRLVKIWEEVLQKEKVGVNDDFFALGGHSLTAIQLIIRIEKNFGVKISLRDLLSKPTIDSFSGEISTLKWVKDKSEELVIEGDELVI